MRGTRRGARRAQGPDHEGGAAAGHHSGRAAAGIRRRADQAAEPGAADGLGLRQAPHERRARRRLAEEVRELRAPAGGRRLARPGASRAARSTARTLACKLQYPDMQSAVEADLQQLQLLFAIRRRIDPAIDTSEIAKEIGARAARGARLSPRGQARRALPRHAGGRATRSACRASGPSCRPAGCSPSTGSRAAACSTTRTTPLADAQPARHRDVHGLVVAVQPLRRHPRRSASRQLHGVRRRQGRAGRHQPARLRLHPHLPAELRRRRGRSLPRAAARRRRPAWCTPTRPGASSGSTAS